MNCLQVHHEAQPNFCIATPASFSEPDLNYAKQT
jgi:hypothetical protein